MLHINGPSIPFILNRDYLVALFGSDKEQLLTRFEGFCGSAEFRQACHTNAASVAALRENRARHADHLLAIHRKQLLHRRHLVEFRQLELKWVRT